MPITLRLSRMQVSTNALAREGIAYLVGGFQGCLVSATVEHAMAARRALLRQGILHRREGARDYARREGAGVEPVFDLQNLNGVECPFRATSPPGELESVPETAPRCFSASGSAPAACGLGIGNGLSPEQVMSEQFVAVLAATESVQRPASPVSTNASPAVE